MSEGITKLKYFSPKLGRMKIDNRKDKSELQKAVDCLSKTKSKEVLLKDLYLLAMNHSSAVQVQMSIGVSGLVSMKDLKAVAKTVHGQFSVTRQEDIITFSWDGGVMSIGIEDCSFPVLDIGKEVFVFNTPDDLGPCLLSGGSSVANDNPRNVLNRVYFNGNRFLSSDGVMLSNCAYEVDSPAPFSMNYEAYALWIKLDLPMRYLAVYEEGCRIMLDKNVILWDRCLASEDPSDIFLGVLDRFRPQGKIKTKLPSKVWANLKKMKGMDEVCFANGRMFSSDIQFENKLKIFDNDCDEFVIKIEEMNRLRTLVTANSDFSFIQMEENEIIQNYLLVEPDPEYDETIIVAGCNVTKETQND